MSNPFSIFQCCLSNPLNNISELNYVRDGHFANCHRTYQKLKTTYSWSPFGCCPQGSLRFSWGLWERSLGPIICPKQYMGGSDLIRKFSMRLIKVGKFHHPTLLLRLMLLLQNDLNLNCYQFSYLKLYSNFLFFIVLSQYGMLQSDITTYLLSYLYDLPRIISFLQIQFVQFIIVIQFQLPNLDANIHKGNT